MSLEFQVHIKLSNNLFRVYTNNTKSYETLLYLRKDINSFYIPKTFQMKAKDKWKLTTDENDKYIDKLLKSYAKQLIKDRDELINSGIIIAKFDIFESLKFENMIFYRTTTNIILSFF